MKNVLITGASSEVGMSIAKRLETNYNLILIQHKKNINTTEFIKEPEIYTCDFNNEKSLQNLIENFKKKKIDILINVAAYDQNEEIDNIEIENIIDSIKINALAPFILVKELFLKDSKGIVINMASTDGIDTYNEYNLPYATSKATLIHLTKHLDLIYKNLKFYALCPNYINTQSIREMDPIFLKQELKRINQERLIEVEEVSEKIEEIINTLPKNIIIRME